MLLIAISLSLLVIYAGVTLMLRVELEVLSRFYKYVARFLILMGLLGTLYAGCILVLRNCGLSYIHHHKNSHCRMLPQHVQKGAEFNQDSTWQIYHYKKCCPPVYCSEHISDDGDDGIFYPKDCVCCPFMKAVNARDSLSE